MFEVERNKQRYILKDVWIEECCPVSEVEHLKTIAGIEGVPKVICAEDIPGLSMGNLRLGIHIATRMGNRYDVKLSPHHVDLIVHLFIPNES